MPSKDREYYTRMYYKASDVKIRRNAKLRLNRRINARTVRKPKECQKKGCTNTHIKIVFRSYANLKFLWLCEKCAKRFINSCRIQKDSKKPIYDSPVDWYEFGEKLGSSKTPIDHHNYPRHFYMGYRVAFDGPEYERTQFPPDHEIIKLDHNSKKYW